MGKLGDQDVGSIVKLKEDGVLQNYIIVHKGNPDPEIYDESCDGVWLLRQDVIITMAWNNDEQDNMVCDWALSEIKPWLKETMEGKFQSEIQNAIKTVGIPYQKKKATAGYDIVIKHYSKFFLLSILEVGGTNQVTLKDGKKLAYFDVTDEVDEKRIANYQGNPENWWLRTPYTLTSPYQITWKGGIGHDILDYERGIRPAMILPTTLFVKDDGEITVNKAPSTPSSIKVPSTIRAGKEITISWGASTDSEGNLKGYELERKLDAGSWTSVYSGSSLSATDTVPAGTNSVTYRVKAYDSLGLESSYNTSAAMGVINNKAPVIASETGQDLGEKNEPFSFTYTITDADNDSVTVKEWLDGKEKRSYTATLGQDETFSVAAYYGKIANGKHTLKVTASDGSATAEKVWTFIKRIPGGEIRNLALLEALKSIKTGPEVINNLTSTSTTSALSANQGKVLKGLIDDVNSSIADLQVVTGTYTGTGVGSKTISLGFQPKVVIAARLGELWDDGSASMALRGYSAGYNSTALTITSSGFTVYTSSNLSANMNATLRYHYIAFR